MITSYICRSEQRFDRMHIGVDAAVVVQPGEVTVPGIDEHARHVVEEPHVPDLERLAEQVASAGQSGHCSRGGSQHHESVCVAGLLVWTLTCVVDAGQPAAIHPIPEPAREASEGLYSKISITVPTKQPTEDVHMQHPGRNPGIDGARQVGLSAGIQPSGSTQWMRKVTTEVEQPLRFGPECRSGNPRFC